MQKQKHSTNIFVFYIHSESIFPPVFAPRLTSTVANVGDRINLECAITGLPEPTVTWYKDDKPLKEAGLSEHNLQAYLPNTYKLTIDHGESSSMPNSYVPN